VRVRIRLRQIRTHLRAEPDATGCAGGQHPQHRKPKEDSMFKTVVLGLDGSPEAKRALPFALELAEPETGRIIAVHVRELLVGRAGGQPLVANEDEVEAEVRQEVDRIAATGVDIKLAIVTTTAGGPAHVIADTARRENADLIVVGTRGQSQVAGLLLGSVTHRLLHIAPCPVFAVPTRNAKSADQDIAGATASVG
jgi:nucleotide-binding universal stress UspA family protein